MSGGYTVFKVIGKQYMKVLKIKKVIETKVQQNAKPAAGFNCGYLGLQASPDLPYHDVR